MIARQITYFGQQAVVVCDAKCGKAWGFRNRPRLDLSDDPDPSEQASAFRPGWVPRGGSCASAGHTLEQSGPKRCANTGSDPNHSNRANGHRG